MWGSGPPFLLWDVKAPAVPPIHLVTEKETNSYNPRRSEKWVKLQTYLTPTSWLTSHFLTDLPFFLVPAASWRLYIAYQSPFVLSTAVHSSLDSGTPKGSLSKRVRLAPVLNSCTAFRPLSVNRLLVCRAISPMLPCHTAASVLHLSVVSIPPPSFPLPYHLALSNRHI